MLSAAQSAIGQTYKGFVFTKYLELKELKSTLVELTHEASGARVLHIANDDPENLFCLSFRTQPTSSNGVAHILEHTVLCGSKKYPVKDPFFAMARRSLNTYMNALTGQDFTCYPASTQVEKDFYNLLDVYIDAVFHPELKPMSYLQEGHRMEFQDDKLQFQGIVYNEMKGSLSSSDSRLWRAVFQHLFSDLPYAYNTGGDPKEIPNLTYQELKEFHQEFYHPSRCLFFFYGNLPLSKHLDFIKEKALNNVSKLAPMPPLPAQKRFIAPITRIEKYPIAEAESLEKKDILSFAWLTCPISDQGEVLALSFLDSLLMDHDASPLRKALLESKLCTQASSSIDTEISEVPWLIICKGCEAKDANALKEILFQSLKTIAKNPIDQELIDASLHQLEFDRTEINTDDGPFGLTLFMRAALIAQHGCESENGLIIHTLFQELREKLKNPEFISHLIQIHLLENTHFLQLTLQADPTLEKKEAEEERKNLDEIEANLSETEKEKIIAQSDALKEFQEQIEHQSLECLPKVTIKDVSLYPKDLHLDIANANSMSVFHHSCFTNQILYADLLFDLPALSFEDLSLVSLFTRFVTEVGCGGRNYEETLHFAQLYTGGVNANLSLHVTVNPEILRPTISLKGKALERNASKLLNLFADTILSADFTNIVRIDQLLSQHKTALQNRLTKNALNYAIQTSLSGFSSASFIQNAWSGLPYYNQVLKWADNPKGLVEKFLRLQKMLFSGTPNLVLSCDDTHYQFLSQQEFFGLGEKVHKPAAKSWSEDYKIAEVTPQVRFIASPVAFTALGMRTVPYLDPASPDLLLSTELLQNIVLHQEIREKGGAYGAQASYSPSTGDFYFYSYRDPNLAKTIAAFEKAMDKIAKGDFTESHLEEAKLGVLQTLDTPIAPGSRAIISYAWIRAGRTFAMRQAFRTKILNAKREKISKAVLEHLLPQKKILVSFLGETLFEKEKKKIKEKLSILPLVD